MSADDDLLTMLRAVPNLNVYDGFVDADETEKVIDVPLPYVVFYSSPGSDRDGRLCGGVGGRVLQFSVTGVGGDRQQAKWALDKARAALSRQRLNTALIRRSDDNQPVRREDVYTRPEGLPLFYGIDQYGVATTG